MVERQSDRAAVFARAETLLTHDDGFDCSAVVPPIFQASLFTFRTYEEMAETFVGVGHRFIYSRGDNPTVMEFEARIAALEGAEAARAFSSGMAAISASVLAFAGTGDRVVVVKHCYGDAFRFFQRLLPELGITVDYVDGSDAAAVTAALPGARILYLESPSSMVFDLQELPRLATAARRHGAISMIDNSWATPLFQQPIGHGVDLVIHSASKYLGGHSDTVAGVVAGTKDHIGRINERTYPYLGAKLAPFEGWLLLRGLRTLPFRIKRHEQSALAIATRLKGHPDVQRVMHPAFSNHPGSATLLGHTGLFSFEVMPTIDVALFANALRLFRLGVSWGGHESLVVPALASLKQTPGMNSMSYFGVTPETIRLHVGLEDHEDLWADLERALAMARR